MRFVLDDGDGERELVATLGDEGATVADLLAAVGVAPVEAITVEGRVVPSDHTLREAAIPDGTTIRTGRHPTALVTFDRPTATVRIAVVAGTHAGGAVPLDGPVLVGRGRDCQLTIASTTVSERHCRFVADGRGGVTVTDLGSTNGTWVDGQRVPTRGGTTIGPGAVVRCGATALRLEPFVADDRPRGIDPLRHLTHAGTVPFNRPPRPGPPPRTAPMTALPEEPQAASKPVFNVASIVAPLVMGGAMVWITQRPEFALLMLLSPIMLVANTISGRRKSGRDAARARREHRDAVARFIADLRDRQVAETVRRWTETPSVAEVRRRARTPSTRLWERRPADEDQLVLGAGIGSVPYRPVLAAAHGATTADPTPLASEILDASDRLPDAPVAVDLSRGGVVGIVGDRTAALALARSLLVQAAVHHGPADMPVAAVVDPRSAGAWGWLPWLPHTTAGGPGDARLLAVGEEAGDALLDGLLHAEERHRASERAGAPSAAGSDERPSRPTLLVVLDAPATLRGRGAPARAVLRGEAGPVAGIVLAAVEDQLPAVCDTVVTCGSADGDATLVRPGDRLLVDDVLVAGLSEDAAREAARSLAGLEDPEASGGDAGLPAGVDLLDLLDLPDGNALGGAIASSWARSAGGAGLATPIGVTRDGPFVLDLVEDGPHGLLGGTTGSGKSELLRSLVGGLSARHGPDDCTFVLVDYKGGAAFDVCADLPHVVGLVTDLDDHLGERALRCLEAELEHRERRLRAAGVSDLVRWRRLPVADRGAPLPRLLVVVDEFATLKAELPDFVDALVGIAQRGRSLGVHMLLGTQRPSGAVDENVRANSNLRVALRVTDRQDSTDVVGIPDASEIPPSLPGRGVVRIGPGAVLSIQTALVTGRSGRRSSPPVTVRPFRLVPVGPAASRDEAGERDQGPTDLARLVEACRAAFAASDAPPPRRPWPAPLPELLPFDEVIDHGATGADEVPVGLVDLPDEQAQRPATWALGAGPLLVHGVVGSGTTTTVATCVLAACALHPPDELHVQVLDLGRGGLAPLADLPHVGAVVAGREAERRRRLLAAWTDEAQRRRALTAAQLAAEPRLVIAVDGLDTLMAELDDPATFEVGDALLRVFAEAAALRMSPVLTSTRASGLRSTLTSAVEQRWTHRLADPADVGVLGLRPGDVPALVPGRAVRVADARELQVASPGDLGAAVASVAARWPDPVRRTPPTVGVLPSAVLVDELLDAVHAPSTGAWRLPVGRREHDLAVATLPLHRGDHPILFGTPGSGRSGVLGALGEVARRAGLAVVVAAGSRGSPLLADGHEVVDASDLGALLAAPPHGDRLLLVLVDDAERVPDPGAALEALAGDGPRVHLVAAARPEVVQADFGHWLRRAARGRVGGLMRPLGDLGGDLLGARLPRHAPAGVTAGRGWSVAAGTVEFVQYAVVDS